jgi:phosphomannomutase
MGADPDPATRAELAHLVDQGAVDELRERFEHPLAFGTAGLRAPLGAGPARMNRAVVRRTSAGLARYLVGKDAGAAQAGVVVGHDARHGSAEFADDAAKVLAAEGVRAWKFASALPTPLTAFAVRHLGTAAGVMVTASHNPAPDNGYKVYVADGAQVVPPDDTAIAARAAASPVLSDAQLAGLSEGRLGGVDEGDLLAAYAGAVMAVLGPDGPRRLRTVYTPVHGVGGAVLPGLMEEAGFEPPTLVPEQALPDPDFPTAPFPNPEEPGVLDLALARAEALKADLVLANDPDADRLAVALPAPGGGPFRVLTGDQLGILLADHLISTSTGDDRLVATTVVSSSMLSALAERAGVAYAETLTGFKWVARTPLSRPGHRLLFGYEEALGYAVTDAVADKDGLSAALVAAEMAACARHDGGSLWDRLDELEAALGVHATAQWTWRLPAHTAADALARVMARLRSAPPGRLAGLDVTEVRDLLPGWGGLPSSDVLVLRLGAEARVVLRPSGTEPKLKAYLEATAPPGPRDGLAKARLAAQARLGQLRQEVAGLVPAG